MRFTWDEKKNDQNSKKHGVSFELASLVFDDPLAVSVQDAYEDEERWRTMGVVKGMIIILVVHTVTEGQGEDLEEIVRIISARKATPRERRAYEESQ